MKREGGREGGREGEREGKVVKIDGNSARQEMV